MAITKLITDATKLTALLPSANKAVVANRLYCEGDYWQNERAWAGPTPPADLKAREEVITGVARDFTPIPLVGDAVERHVNGVVGKEPAFALTPKESLPEGEEAPDYVDELNSLAGAWWDARNGHEIIANFTQSLLTDERATLRFFLPPDAVDSESGYVSFASMEDALDAIYFEVPAADTATVATDGDSLKKLSLYQFATTENTVNAQGVIQSETRNYLEITFVKNGKTIIRHQNNGKVEFEAEFDLDGEILAYEAQRKPFISEPARRLQNTINYLNSILPKNARYAGSRARHGIGLKHPTVEVNGEEQKVPVNLGAGVFNLWQTSTYTDADGKEKHTPAQLVFEEPVDSGPIRADIAHNIEKLLETFDQSHILLSGDGASSAVALVQKRAAFAQSLLETAPKVEGAIRWLIRTALLLAAALSNDNARLTQLKTLRVDCTVKANSGPLSPDERRVIIEEMQAGVMDSELAMTMLGYEDVDSIKARISSDPMAQLSFLQKCFEVFNTATMTLDAPMAAMLIPFPDDVKETLIKGMANTNGRENQPTEPAAVEAT